MEEITITLPDRFIQLYLSPVLKQEIGENMAAGGDTVGTQYLRRLVHEDTARRAALQEFANI